MATTERKMKDHEIAGLVSDLAAIAREFGQTQQLRERISHRVAAALAAPPVEQQAAQVSWTPGPNVFKDWCSQWFGPDADDDYLAKAVFDLPRMAQRFREQPAPQAGAAGRDKLAESVIATAAHWAYMAEIDNSDAAKAAEQQLREKVSMLAAHPTEQPSQDAAWQKISDEVTLILSDPDSELSDGAKRALEWIAEVAGARAAQARPTLSLAGKEGT